MADDKRTASGAGGARRRRQSATIDLTATEVGAEASAVPPAHETEPRTAATEHPASSSSPPEAPPPKDRKLNLLWDQLAAGLIGGGVVAALFGIFWLATGSTRQDGNDGSRAQVAALQTQVRALSQAKPSTTDSASVERLSAIENAIKASGIALAALNKRGDEIAGNVAAARERADAAAKSADELQGAMRKMPGPASREDVEKMQARVAAVESAVKAAQEKVAKSGEADATARLALAAIALRDAVAHNEPYAAELATAQSLGADEKMTAPLAAFAASGMPNNAALAWELSALLPAMVKAANADLANSSGFIGKLQANAEKLVRIRPVDARAGSDPAAVLARIEVSAAHNDIGSARAELAKLPANVRALAADWEARVGAREAAIAASRALAADAARALTAR